MVSREFNGKQYRLAATYPKKTQADSFATRHRRKDGWSARLVKTNFGYAVWVRKSP